MKQLTPQEREALMADMRSFFEEDFVDGTPSEEDIVVGEAGPDAGNKIERKCGRGLVIVTAEHE